VLNLKEKYEEDNAGGGYTQFTKSVAQWAAEVFE